MSTNGSENVKSGNSLACNTSDHPLEKAYPTPCKVAFNQPPNYTTKA